MKYSYFAKDGNYGNAEEMVIIETTKWSLKDWGKAEKACDKERLLTAQKIAKKYRTKK